MFAISIALEREGQIVAGVIYNPASDEMYVAEKGQGAFGGKSPAQGRRAHRFVAGFVRLRDSPSRQGGTLGS
jgi:fructose-1,6-bisphosphatase/inositol monophosphatase family enzyme